MNFALSLIRGQLLAGCFFLLLLIPAHAQVSSALKPLTDKYELDRKALADWAETQVKPVRERYLAALTAAQKSAAAALKTGDLAAIAAELLGVNSGTLPPDAPPDLPRALSQHRRAYVSMVATVQRAVLPRQRELQTKYLKSLQALEAAVPSTKDAALAEAIAAEKQRVVAAIHAAGGGPKHRNVIPNSDFSPGEPGGWPPGWKKEARDVEVSDAIIIVEGNSKFLRFRRLQAIRRANLLPENEIAIPENAKSAEFSVRLRVKGLVPGKDHGKYPGVHITARDARGEEVSGESAVSKEDTTWKRVSGRLEIPANAKTLRVSTGPSGAAGIIDLDDIEVEFR